MIYLTENAAKEIRRIKKQAALAETVPIRVGVKGGGCSGLTYTFEFDSHKTRHDLECESQGLSILVDKKSLLYIRGTKIDWGYDLNDHGLKFFNPSAKSSCGCQTSFVFDPAGAPPEAPEAPSVFQLKF